MTAFKQFNHLIGPENLLALVRNTAPFYFDPAFAFPPTSIETDMRRLSELGGHPYGWLDILRHAARLPAVADPTLEQRTDYFALCMACHHGTVATFIPTDVDSKIRGVLWQHVQKEHDERRRMFDFTVQALEWDVRRISTRWSERSGVGPVSGHNGEMLGVLAGALGTFIKGGDAEYIRKAEEAIDAELRREASEFDFVLKTKGDEIELLRLAISLTHNCGDLDQGISFWTQNPIYDAHRTHFGRLAHENTAPYNGTYQIAAKLYKNMLSSEGHRHYPLRELRCLRTRPDFLLPLGPFFDDWGTTVARHPALSDADRADVLGALALGCAKVKGQLGYYRAISGLVSGLGGSLGRIERHLTSAQRHQMKDAEIKRHIALSKESFESSLRKKALQVLGRR